MRGITKPNKTIVYILGAGASAEDGAPVITEMLDKAFHNFGGESGIPGMRLMGITDEKDELDIFKSVFELADHFYGLGLVHAMDNLYQTLILPGHINFDVEDFFTRIDNMVKGKETYGLNWDKQKIAQVAKDAGFFFYRTLCLETGLDRRPKHYLAFVENALKPGIRHCIITFNYDLLLEEGLCNYDRYFNNKYKNPIFNRDYFYPKRLPWTYGVPFASISWASVPYRVGDENLADVHYFKLHGSLNWGICPVTKEITMYPAFASARVYEEFYKGYYKCHNGQHIMQPLLIPPTKSKDIDIPGLKLIWEKAAKSLTEAEEIHVIGYSLPEADTGAQELFSENITHKLKRLVLVNPNSSHREKFRTLIGRSLETSEYVSFKEYLIKEHHSTELVDKESHLAGIHN